MALRSSVIHHMFFLSMLFCSVGCTSDKNEGPRSALDTLAEISKAKQSGGAAPPAGTGTKASLSAEGQSPVKSVGSFKVKLQATTGDIVIHVHRDWAPVGAHRFYELVKAGFYDECRFFRVIPNFMVQFGISGDPQAQRRWDQNIQDDPVIKSNEKGYVTFATAGPNTRTTQVFINYKNNANLDRQGFAPFGEVIEGMQNAEAIFAEYLEEPDQGQITKRGNEYLNSKYPRLDYIKKAEIIEETEE